MAVNIHDLEKETGLGGKVIRRKIRALNLGAQAAGLKVYSWEDNSAQLKLIRLELAKLAGKPASKPASPASNGKAEGAVAAAPEAKAQETGLFLANSSGVINGFHKVEGAAKAAPGPMPEAVPVSSPDSGQSSQPEAAAPAPEAPPDSPGKARARRSRPTSTQPLADIHKPLPAARTKEETDYLRTYQIKELQPGHKLECEICLDRLQMHTKAVSLTLLKPKRWANVCREHCREGGVGPALARGEEVEGYNVAEILRTRNAGSAR